MELKGKRVLAVGAHPDDVEFMCAGTLLLLKERGAAIDILTLTSGDGGSLEYPPGEIAQIRRREARKAAEMLGANYHNAGLSDFGIFNDDSSNRKITALIREVDPWLVLTHPPVDYLSDHELTSRLVRNACFYGPVPNYDTSRFGPARRSSGICFLYYAQPIEGIDIFGDQVRPHFYVDISEKIGLKEEMLACHESQRNWLRSHHGMDEYLDSMRRWGRILAAQVDRASIEYAEAFRQHRGHAYPSENVLKEVLPQQVCELK